LIFFALIRKFDVSEGPAVAMLHLWSSPAQSFVHEQFGLSQRPCCEEAPGFGRYIQGKFKEKFAGKVLIWQAVCSCGLKSELFLLIQLWSHR
jgi:hypothetical protein